jgi:TolB-like protein/class 3 adenylate cyclase
VTTERVERRLAAVLAADVAGYSRLMGADEEGTLARLKAIRKTLVDPTIASHRGRIVKTTGDGMLVEFASAVDAVRGAVEVQRGMADRNTSLPQDQRIEFRIGIHVGDIIIDENDIFGGGVNVAARLEGIAEPGGVCISNDTYRQVRGKVEIVCDDMGPQSLKNIAEPMQAWRVRLTDQTSSAGQSGLSANETQALALPDKPSIAVLPFQNMSGDPEQEYFADGMVEDIITALSRFNSLFVIARNSSFTYKGKSVDVKQVGRDLGVRYVLEGSVRKVAGKVRITGQLIEAATGSHLWADKFDGDLKEVFELQDNVTMSVVGAIVPRLQRADFEFIKRKPPNSWNAYDYFLRGMALNLQFNLPAIREAIALFRKAIEFDPLFGPSYSRLALCIYQLRNVFLQPVSENERIEALELADRGIEHAPDDATALACAAFVYANLNSEFDRGFLCAERAISINPNYSMAWNAKGWTSMQIGEIEIALEAFARALRLNPLDPVMTPNALLGHATACYVLGKYEEGVDWSRQVLAQRPTWLYGLILFVGNAALAGRLTEARETATRIKALYPSLRTSHLRMFFSVKKLEQQEKTETLIREIGLPE